MVDQSGPDASARPPEAEAPNEGAPLTARERRRQRLKTQQRRALPLTALKGIAVMVVAALVIAGGVWAWQHRPQEPPTGHEHSVFRMFVDTEEISFNDPVFDFSNTRYLRGHIHLSGGESTSAQYVIHEEGQLGITLKQFFEVHGLTFTKSKVTLHPTAEGHMGRTFANNATHSWELWIDHCKTGPDNWTLESKFEKYAPVHHDRMLVIFAPHGATIAGLANQTAVVPTEAQLDAQLKEQC